MLGGLLNLRPSILLGSVRITSDVKNVTTFGKGEQEVSIRRGIVWQMRKMSRPSTPPYLRFAFLISPSSRYADNDCQKKVCQLMPHLYDSRTVVLSNIFSSVHHCPKGLFLFFTFMMTWRTPYGWALGKVAAGTNSRGQKCQSKYAIKRHPPRKEGVTFTN